MPQLTYIKGRVDVSTYQKTCASNHLTNPCVFIFPGNPSHHTSETTLYSIKGGAGLAIPAKNLGQAGFPVLSLPTTGLENWRKNRQQQDIADQAIQDLYRAMGAGFDLMLPVRKHQNNTYFESPLANAPGLEPSFWGGIQKTSNKPLANHYITALNQLHLFIDEINQKGEAAALAELPAQFATAYLDGADKKQTHHAWLKPTQPQTSSSNLAPTPPPLQTASSRNHFFPEHEQQHQKSTKPDYQASTSDLIAGVLCLASAGFLVAALTGGLPMTTGLLIAGGILALAATLFMANQPHADNPKGSKP